MASAEKGKHVRIPLYPLASKSTTPLPRAGRVLVSFRWPESRAYTLLLCAACLTLAIVGTVLAVNLIHELAAQYFVVSPRHSHYDFLAFYSAGHFATRGEIPKIYDASSLAAFQRTFVSHPVGAQGYMPFLNPPFAAVLQAPLVLLSEPSARVAWFAINLLLAASMLAWMTSSIHGSGRALLCLALLGTFPIYQTLIEGQWSLVMLLGCLAALHFAHRGSPVLGG